MYTKNTLHRLIDHSWSSSASMVPPSMKNSMRTWMRSMRRWTAGSVNSPHQISKLRPLLVYFLISSPAGLKSLAEALFWTLELKLAVLSKAPVQVIYQFCNRQALLRICLLDGKYSLSVSSRSIALVSPTALNFLS